MTAIRETTQRRVYVLPIELVDRITAYQMEKGLSSEVEAVRNLIDEALQGRDDWKSLANRFKEKLQESGVLSDVAKELLVGHPLVENINFEGKSTLTFTLTTGERVKVDRDGTVKKN